MASKIELTKNELKMVAGGRNEATDAPLDLVELDGSDLGDSAGFDGMARDEIEKIDVGNRPHGSDQGDRRDAQVNA